jgi:sugar phosphate permease
VNSLVGIVASLIAAILVGKHSRGKRGSGYFLAAVLALIATALVLIEMLTMRNPVE